jgi:hypothetical protein
MILTSLPVGNFLLFCLGVVGLSRKGDLPEFEAELDVTDEAPLAFGIT